MDSSDKIIIMKNESDLTDKKFDFYFQLSIQ